MDNDDQNSEWAVMETVKLSGETKNCYVFEPDEGSELVSKIYIRKSVFTGKPASITVCIEEQIG